MLASKIPGRRYEGSEGEVGPFYGVGNTARQRAEDLPEDPAEEPAEDPHRG